MASITINGITIDPDAEGPVLAAAGALSDDASKSNYILVQTKGPLTKEQKDELQKLKVEILEYVPENTYLCHYKPTNLKPIRDLSYVTWANVYMRGFKVSPNLRSDEPSEGRGAAVLMGEAVRTGALEPTQLVDIVLHKNVSSKDAYQQIARAAHVDPEALQVEESSGKIRLSAQPRYFDAMAQVDGVRHIEKVADRKLHNNVARQIMRVGVPLSTTLFEGTGEIVAICDTGFDKGSRTDVHPAFTGRVKKLYALGRSSASDPHGHGTHVAGSVLGDGNSVAMGGVIRGTAPKAKLVLQSVMDSLGRLGGLPDDL